VTTRWHVIGDKPRTLPGGRGELGEPPRPLRGVSTMLGACLRVALMPPATEYAALPTLTLREQRPRLVQPLQQLWRLHPRRVALAGETLQDCYLRPVVLALPVEDGQFLVPRGSNAPSACPRLGFRHLHQVQQGFLQGNIIASPFELPDISYAAILSSLPARCLQCSHWVNCRTVASGQSCHRKPHQRAKKWWVKVAIHGAQHGRA